MYFSLKLELSTSSGGWDSDSVSRVVAHVGIEAKSFQDALQKLSKKYPELIITNEAKDTIDLN